MTDESRLTVAPEDRSGLPPWTSAQLPVPPYPKGLAWLGTVGPGVIVLGISIGSGEFLLGPAIFVKYGLTLLWVTGVAAFLQTIFNTELMRYTLATGEPVITGFMRTRPSATFWAWTYAAMYFLQMGWPAWAGAAAGAGVGLVVATMGAWILLKTQLDSLEGMTRSITDIIWTGSRRVRAVRGGDVRVVYYAVLGLNAV